MTDIVDNLRFVLERLNWTSVIDILLVTIIFFAIFLLLRDTQAVVLLRGVLLLIIVITIVTSFQLLPAFSWLVDVTLPTLLVAIPVIFAPEIRRALERLGRISSILPSGRTSNEVFDAIQSVTDACTQLSRNRHGAIIIMQRLDELKQYVETGVSLDAEVSDKLMLQIFYPNTPLHDGAVIISGGRILAASAVMPLATGDIQVYSPERQLGLRHRAALGISEATDAIAVVVSEETGAISIAHGGRIYRRLDARRLEMELTTLFEKLGPQNRWEVFLARILQRGNRR